MNIDDTDLQILECLQTGARCPNAQIARCVELAPSAVAERIRKLEDKGILRSYEARLDPEAIGLGMLAFLFVRAAGGPSDSGTAEKLAEIPGVLEVHHIAGEDCFLLKARTDSPRGLRKLLTEDIGSLGTVLSTRTTIVLETVKETSVLPLPRPRPASAK